jgi:hypothetical protein
MSGERPEEVSAAIPPAELDRLQVREKAPPGKAT